MFQRAQDVKNELILTVLSWVDYLKPKYCVFENVKGFLQYNLMAVQTSRHRVTGGIDKGGLKFLIRSLITLGYQVRYGLLQAGHYGTPQARVRFFVVAARHGSPLADLPQPTHYFEESRLTISSSLGKLAPPWLDFNAAVHDTVTIRDAIGDLMIWDW